MVVEVAVTVEVEESELFVIFSDVSLYIAFLHSEDENCAAPAWSAVSSYLAHAREYMAWNYSALNLGGIESGFLQLR